MRAQRCDESICNHLACACACWFMWFSFLFYSSDFKCIYLCSANNIKKTTRERMKLISFAQLKEKTIMLFSSVVIDMYVIYLFLLLYFTIACHHHHHYYYYHHHHMPYTYMRTDWLIIWVNVNHFHLGHRRRRQSVGRWEDRKSTRLNSSH